MNIYPAPLVLVAALSGTLCMSANSLSAEVPRSEAPFGRYQVRTVPLDKGIRVRSATYTPTGKVLVSYEKDSGEDRRQVNLAIVDDDGRNFRPFFSQLVPVREKDNGIRFMVFNDGRRIFLGDFIIECAPSLDDCARSQLIPVQYPAEVASGDYIANRWSEVIVAPDNRHIAWTTLLANYTTAVVLTGELRRHAGGYVIASPRIISTLEPFKKDPKHADGVIPQTIRNGEVKQFVHGGTAISLVGAVKRDVPDSVVQDLMSERLAAVTDTPGYDETTIFSPDERLGIVMSARFSPRSDPAILGLVPRPYAASLNMGLGMFTYTYAVTGVRKAREGNVGPALIDIRASQKQADYLGVNLNTQSEWVFNSPISWHPSSKKGMWIEGLRGGDARRIQIVELPGYRPGATARAKRTPDAIPYATSDLSGIPALVRKSNDVDAKVYGRKSGHIEYRRSTNTVEKVYVNFSDDGRNVYSGRETMRSNPRGNSTYAADLRVSGQNRGVMDLIMTFGPLGGELPARLVFDTDAAGNSLSHGYAEFNGKRLTVDALLP